MAMAKRLERNEWFACQHKESGCFHWNLRSTAKGAREMRASFIEDPDGLRWRVVRVRVTEVKKKRKGPK